MNQQTKIMRDWITLEHEYENLDRQIAECVSAHNGDHDGAVIALSARIAMIFQAPAFPGVYGDLLQIAAQAIDWREIADSMIGEAAGRAAEDAE